MADAFEHLSTTTLGSDAASVAFTSISSAYEHLQLRMAVKSTQGTAGSLIVRIQFNSDTGTNYSHQGLDGYQSTDTQREAAGVDEIAVYGGGTDTMNVHQFGGIIVNIHDYANTSKFTSVRSMGTNIADGTSNEESIVSLTGGVWESTAAVSSITLLSNVGDFKTNSEFSLYGMRSS